MFGNYSESYISHCSIHLFGISEALSKEGDIAALSHRSSRPEVFCKKVFLEISQSSQGNTCARISFLIKLLASACSFIKIETLAQVFSCEFCKISKSTFS